MTRELDTTVRHVRIDVSPVLSALVAEPPGQTAPVGLLVALHGGGSRAAYWDSPVDPHASLLRSAAAQGWRVLALDRPGYGSSADLVRGKHRLRLTDQTPLVERAISAMRLALDPVVLIGHSLGAILTVNLAVQNRLPGLAAIALGGMPIAYTPEQEKSLRGLRLDQPFVRRPESGATLRSPVDWYGPSGTWDRNLLAHRDGLVSHTPTGEFLDALNAPRTLPSLLGQVRVPVHVAAAEHERTTASPEIVLKKAEGALVRAPHVETLLLAGSGHNLSLGHQAARYHAEVLAFLAAAVR
jgi:hypothetical protein